jgi:cellulose synthase operon protein C
MKGKKSATNCTNITNKSRKKLYLSVFICGLFSLCFAVVWFHFNPTGKVSAEDVNREIEEAIYTKQDFFGAEAFVPLPTKKARENLAAAAGNSPENSLILAKLADYDEKLGLFDEAEKSLIRLSEIDAAKNDTLATFYQRRGAYQKEAEVLRKILFTTEPQNRAAIFERLIDTARIHELKEYLQPAFYEQVTKENPDTFDIFRKLSEKLVEENDYSEALKYVRQARQMFPEKQSVLLDKEIEILLATNQSKEAETVYIQAFNPFWSADEAEKFYEFLSEQDRLREYGAELKARFKSNPADFETGVKLALFQNHDYRYGNDEIAPIIAQIERAKKVWTTDELVTATRLLLQENEGETASRFLYTLYLREDFRKNSELRAKVLYQLFEMFSDAENRKLPLTKGDLRFYEDVAKSDTNPGIATGILSLIFSDSNPQSQLEEQETVAAKHFNRAAAYRIFEEYKKENPNSNELAQMYLDLVRLYTSAKETEIAGKTLDEFAAKYENSSDYANAAMKLADSFSATGQEPKARETFQKVLDYLGKRNKSLAPKRSEADVFSSDSKPENYEMSNTGINLEKPAETPQQNYYDDASNGNFHDYLGRKTDVVTYADVLEKFVNSLAKEKQTAEILALYSNEIAKYQTEEWLYEKRLTWLEQTNLTDEKLKFYKTSLARFQNDGWRDKLARFFVREKRNAEFAALSEDLVGKLNDAEVQNYLSQMIDGRTSSGEFQKQLYLKLYLTAHQRFPHNISFVNGLLSFYKSNKQEAEWRKLSAAYYFESPEIRETFLDRLAEKGELRAYLQTAQNNENSIYELFRADACARLSDYENAVEAYRKLDQSYPNDAEYSERTIAFTRSFGQKNRALLAEAATISQAKADYEPSSAIYRTRSGEIFAELGSYEKSREEWEKLIETATGSREVYLDTATVYWDYYQYEDALRTIRELREKVKDDALYAFECGAILESQHKKSEAFGEYVKALDGSRDEEQKEKAENRLTTLVLREKENTQAIDVAYQTEKSRRKDSAFLSLGYAEFLVESKQDDKAETILNRTIAQSRSVEFLEAAKDFYQSADNKIGERIALGKLAETTQNPRRTIRYNLQLAASYEANNERESAKLVMAKLIQKFPTNYGVFTETSNFYRRLGYEQESAQVLQNALPRSKGGYQNAIARMLAGRLIQINRVDSAEIILTKLHAENESDADIFRELADVLVRTGKPESLRKAFDETVKAIKSDSKDRREVDDQVAELRSTMIETFTKLKDYDSAIEQHIEIINREPENAQLTDNAVAYIRRYGGGEKLLDYYLKLSAEAFKNYRWNLVLARIYESNKDLEHAAKNYETAIVNQPEMVELYAALAEIEAKRANYDAALKNLDTILELTNGDASYIKKKIEILKKAGRIAEIEVEKAKLPAVEEKKIIVNEFEEAGKLAFNEKEKAREIYRLAFAKLDENPLSGELKSSDISGFVTAVREEEPLDQINGKLWNLRDKLIVLADEDYSTDAGAARNRLGVLEGAMTESIGNIAVKFGTDEELAALHEDLSRRIENISPSDDKNQTLSLLQNLCRRAGFGDLEEAILNKKAAAPNTPDYRHFHLQTLVDFYNERGAYRKTFDALEKYQSDNLTLKAETARLVGNREKELEALRAIYWKPSEKLAVTNDANAARYLDILFAENREELQSLTDKTSAHQLQLINFLLGKGERKLAHAAIANAGLSNAWTISRHAETSLALREFEDAAECFFCDALQFVSIGEMVAEKPDKTRFLINDDWFRLTREYGEWLGEKDGWRENRDAGKYLSAMTENQPQNADEQFKLGVFYLEKKDANRAVEHLKLAAEMNTGEEILANLGAAYYLAGDKVAAEEAWNRIFTDDEYNQIKSGLLYFQTLQKYGLTEKAREKLPPLLVQFLENNDAEKSEEFQDMIRAVAESFSDEAQKAAYFRLIIQKRPTDVSLAAMLVNENLIARNRQQEFYELLIIRSDGINNYDSDYKYEAVRQRLWNTVDAESIYRQETGYKTEEPKADRIEWQKKYLELLFELRENSEVEKLIAKIEKDLNNRYARPSWLGLANIRRQIRDGKPDVFAIENYTGIAVSDAATEMKPPSVELFNDVTHVLKEEGKTELTIQISESFFARMLALEQFDAANFTGLSRVLFQKGETEKGLRILRLMIDAGDETMKETAAAQVAAIDIIKSKAADATKMSPTVNNLTNRANALKIAAEVAAEVNLSNASIAFRRQLLEANSTDDVNKIELAKMLSAKNEVEEVRNLLTQIINDKSSLRPTRWQARMMLNVEIPNRSFDSFSQFYTGNIAVNSNQNDAAENFYINSLIADKDAETSVRQELIKVYAIENKFFAALKLAEIDRAAKSDALLQTLSDAAEKVGDFHKAIEFEQSKSGGGNQIRIAALNDDWNKQKWRATDFWVDTENTNKL